MLTYFECVMYIFNSRHYKLKSMKILFSYFFQKENQHILNYLFKRSKEIIRPFYLNISKFDQLQTFVNMLYKYIYFSCFLAFKIIVYILQIKLGSIVLNQDKVVDTLWIFKKINSETQSRECMVSSRTKQCAFVEHHTKSCVL